MPKELYNEGRVTGFSAYELYVKHALSENPEEDPATEREWLAAQLNQGTSLILKVSPGKSGPHTLDVPLPEGSTLVAANTIVGSIFFGECECDELGWATKVINYGQGISNTSAKHPEGQDPLKYPTGDVAEFTDEYKKEFLQYIKILPKPLTIF